MLSDGQLFGQQATQNDLNAWINAYSLTVTSVIEAPGSYMQTLQALGIREGTAIVEIPAMRVVWYDAGDQSGSTLVTTGAFKAIDEMLRLLPP